MDHVDAPARPAPSEFGLLYRLRGAARRRIGLSLMRVRYRRMDFGQHCDVRSPSSLRVARGARVSFGDDCILDHGITVECRGRIEVGDRTIFGHHCTLAASELIEIGEDCLIAELVSIRDHDHDFSSSAVPVSQQGETCAPVRIGRNVWVGGKVTITRGVTIGDNAVVGANAVVTRDVPADCVAVGVPARVTRRRDADAGSGPGTDPAAAGTPGDGSPAPSRADLVPDT